jgi:hypothetical protein
MGNVDACLTPLRVERHKISEALRALWRTVSFIVAKTSRMLLASETSVMLRSSEGQLQLIQREKIVVITEDIYLSAHG